MLLGKTRGWFGRILFETIPTFLLQKLTFCYEKVRLWKKLHPISRQIVEEEVKVYDLVDCGPNQRFVISPNNPLIVHNCSYNAGPGKIRQTLGMQGIEISMEETKAMHKKYWDIFAGVKAYEKFLHQSWERNEGWFLNAIGRPICVAQDYIKDAVNRATQSCIAEGTLVVTNKGLIPIEQISLDHLLWDGQIFSTHQGLIDKGLQEVIELNGAYMTPDHEVLVNDTWQEAKDVRVDTIKETIIHSSWYEVWGLCVSIIHRLAQKGTHLCRRTMLAWHKSSRFVKS